MSKTMLLKALERYQKSSLQSKLRRDYLRNFTPKMIYRTTKNENPTTTRQQVKKVLARLA
ncbi:MAG: hypothetical protein ACD_41C00001G0005 [uncultured bacterium]|nr:MAG: hypothetical protein ACD_41C00001G0005 [uncultured bacterium]